MTGILVVDDDSALRRWARRVLEAQQYETVGAQDAGEAKLALSNGSCELALLDFNLPGESGLHLLSHIRVMHTDTSVLMVTGHDDMALATSAIELGAFGYLVKPVRAGELLINVANAMHRRRREAELLRRVEGLEGSREALERALREVLSDGATDPDVVRVVESDNVQRLVRLAEFRDAQTGQHLIRMSRYCEILGRSLGLDEGWCEQLRLASELHDVGKVAIPDRILLKPGGLTESERSVMRTHAEIGHTLLADAPSELMQMAAQTALTHHERWDGGGYPQQLTGEAIPLEGRIAAVADVFDALTSDRVYRPAVPVGLAIEMMESERGRHFEPAMFDALHRSFGLIDLVRREYSD